MAEPALERLFRSVQLRRGFMGFTIAPLQKRADQAGPVGSAAVFGHVDGAHPARGSPARNRLATPLRGETGSTRSTDPGRGGSGCAGFADQRLEGLVHAHDRALGVRRAVVVAIGVEKASGAHLGAPIHPVCGRAQLGSKEQPARTRDQAKRSKGLVGSLLFLGDRGRISKESERK